MDVPKLSMLDSDPNRRRSELVSPVVNQLTRRSKTYGAQIAESPDRLMMLGKRMRIICKVRIQTSHEQLLRRRQVRNLKLLPDYNQIKLQNASVKQHVSEEPSADSPPSELVGFSNNVWQNHGLNILLFVLRFINIITKANFATSFKLMKQSVFILISDRAADYDYYRYNNYFKYEKPSMLQSRMYWVYLTMIVPVKNTKFVKQMKTLLDKSDFLLEPEQFFMVLWNVFILIVLTLNIFYVALRWSFPIGSLRHQNTWKETIFDAVPNYAFLLEIVLKFNTCYYERGNLIKNRVKIARTYIWGSFWLDLIVVIPFFITFAFNLSYFDLLIVLKVVQIQKLADSLFARLELTSNQIAAFDLFKLVYMIILVAHFCACLWYMIGTLTLDEEKCWIKYVGLVDAEWDVLYFTSFYWSIITMTTIGYGDVTPQNVTERQFVTAMTLLSCGIFAYSINNIGAIFGELSKKSNQFKTDMNTLKKYLRTKGINSSLQEKIRRYFEFIWSDDNDDDHDQEFKFEQLIPDQLKDEMATEINLRVIRKIRFLCENFSEQFLVALSKHFKEKRFGPEEAIYTQGRHSEAFYILSNGEVQEYIQLSHHIVKVIDVVSKDSAIFGHLDFFMDRCHQSNAKSSQVSYVLEIHKKRFLKTLEDFPHDFQRYCEMRDLVQFSYRLEEIGYRCKACGKTNHTVVQCPMIMGTPNRAKVLLNHRKQTLNDRAEHNRTNQQRRLGALSEQANLQESVINFLLSNEEYTDHLQDIKEQLKQTIKNQMLVNDIIQNPSVLRSSSMNRQQSEFSGNPSLLQTPSSNKWQLLNSKRQNLRNKTKFSFEKSKTAANEVHHHIFNELMQQRDPYALNKPVSKPGSLAVYPKHCPVPGGFEGSQIHLTSMQTISKEQINEEFNMCQSTEEKREAGEEGTMLAIPSLRFADFQDFQDDMKIKEQGMLQSFADSIQIQHQPKHQQKQLSISNQGQDVQIRIHPAPSFNLNQSSPFLHPEPQTPTMWHIPIPQQHSPPQQSVITETNHKIAKQTSLQTLQQKKSMEWSALSEEEDPPVEYPTIPAKHKDIYYEFENRKSYAKYFKASNVEFILRSNKRFKQIRANSQALRRQQTIMNLLSQKRQRIQINKEQTQKFDSQF